MDKGFDPGRIALPPELEGKLFFTVKEFAALAGVTRECVYGWNRKGYLKLKRYSPRCLMVPVGEALRYLRGELMEPRHEGAEPELK